MFLSPSPLPSFPKENLRKLTQEKHVLGDRFLGQGLKMGKVGTLECCLLKTQGATHPVTPCLMDFTGGTVTPDNHQGAPDTYPQGLGTM